MRHGLYFEMGDTLGCIQDALQSITYIKIIFIICENKRIYYVAQWLMRHFSRPLEAGWDWFIDFMELSNDIFSRSKCSWIPYVISNVNVWLKVSTLVSINVMLWLTSSHLMLKDIVYHCISCWKTLFVIDFGSKITLHVWILFC